uniref:hypothetical protein n=1 Tax=Russula rosea TaxID=176822 RepID=UPI002027B702|nr:hypothetical protein NDC34_mgp08 [Russula rosea]UHA57046.1 hypothetical protein [Russula rosea]
MKTIFFFELILILIVILAINGFIYILTYFNLKNTNSSENISVITNSSQNDVLAPTLLIASNPIRLTSSDSSRSNPLSLTSSNSSASDTLSITSSETNVSDTSSVASSDTLVSQNTFEDDDFLDLEVNYDIVTHTENSILSDMSEASFSPDVDVFENTTSLDSITILNGQTLEQWRDLAMDLHELPVNTAANILQQVKFEELNVLYSQDIILYAITQTELRLIIELIPAMDLFKPGINHFILTIMSYYHL